MRFLIVSAALLITACGDGKSSKRTPPVDPDSTTIPDPTSLIPKGPDNPEKVASGVKVGDLSVLPEKYAAELKTWLQKPKKSCDIGAIFNEAKRPEAPLKEAYDQTMLLNAMGQKLWLTNATGDVLILSRPLRPGNTGFSNRSITKDGKTIQFASDLTAEGMCRIKINNQEVVSLPVTSGLGAVALLRAGKFTDIESDRAGSADYKDGLTIVNLSAIEEIQERFRIPRIPDLTSFSIEGYTLGEVVSRYYEASPSSALFQAKEQTFRGWFKGVGALTDYLIPTAPSWSDSSTISVGYVPTAIDTQQLSQLQGNVVNQPRTPIPLEWTLEFDAWEANPEKGTWIARPAQVKVNAELASYQFIASLQAANIKLASIAISKPDFGRIPDDHVNQCIKGQTTFWLNAFDSSHVYYPSQTFLPCERLPGLEKPIILADIAAKDEDVRRHFEDIISKIPVEASLNWDEFNFTLAQKIGKDTFPFTAQSPLLEKWKFFFDRYAAKYKYEQAIELSSRISHGCTGTYSESILEDFEKKYFSDLSDFERMNLVNNLRANCRRS